MDSDSVDSAMSHGHTLGDLAMRLCAQPSVSGSEGGLADAVEAFLRERTGLEVLRDGDAIVTRTHWDRSTRVILAGHLDTVPSLGNMPPVWLEAGDPRIRKDVAGSHSSGRVLWGRGSVDMKGSDAVFLHLAATFGAPRCDVTYVFYDHEEVPGPVNGLARLSARHPDWLQGDFAVVGEPTACGIEGGCNGSLWFDVIFHGTAAHSARAWLGDNAIYKAAPLLALLAAHEPATVTVDGLEYRESLSVTQIAGGTAPNIIPDECRAHVNYRFAPDKTVDEARAVLFGADCGARVGAGEREATGGLLRGYTIEVTGEAPAACPGLAHPAAQDLARIVEKRTGRAPRGKLGWTDVARFAALGIPAVNLGAGDPALAHKPDEQLPESDLGLLASILTDWLA